MSKIDITLQYPEFGYKVHYTAEDLSKIDWVVYDEDDNIAITGSFYSADFYKSTFNVVQSNIPENKYENLFYLYFENIKLKCIDFVEYEDAEVIG